MTTCWILHNVNAVDVVIKNENRKNYHAENIKNDFTFQINGRVAYSTVGYSADKCSVQWLSGGGG